MAIEILEDSVRYQAKTKLKDLALSTAQTKNLSKVQDDIDLGVRIFKWLQALDYGDYLTKSTRDQIVRALVDMAEINDFGVAPYLGNIDPPSLLVGIPGRDGETGSTGPEGGGVPFSATNVTTDTICDSFSITESRGVEYTFNVYDDSGSDMKILRLQGGWSADGTSYGDDGGIGQTIQGDCSGITFSIIVSGTTVQLFATVTSGTWEVSGTRKYIPNNGNGIVNPTTLASGRIWVGNASNSPTAVTVSGDISLSTAGVASITSGSIVNSDISGTAAIAASKLAAMTASKAVVTNSSGFITTSTTTATQIGYLSNVSSDVQTQLDSKISSASGAISTVVSTDLTASRAVIANALGKIAVSSVTSTELSVLDGITASTAELNTLDGIVVTTTELNYLDNATGNIQAQIDAIGGVQVDDSISLRKKVVEIGSWDMSASGSVFVAVTHGLSDFTKIREVSVMIINDEGTRMLPLVSTSTLGASGEIVQGAVSNINSSGITLFRKDPSFNTFNATDYNDTSINRGWITFTYEA